MAGTSLILPSGFTFDYTNMLAQELITVNDVDKLRDRIGSASQAIDTMRKTGEVKGHFSKDGAPELVLFSQLPYIAEGNINSPASIARLKAFGQRVRNNIDAVTFLGIGGSYLGNKVIFDIHCGEFWNTLSAKERDGYPKIYFSGNNMDPRRTSELLSHILSQAIASYQHTGRKYKVMLVVMSKSGATVDTMSSFLIAYEALKNKDCLSTEVVAVTDPAPAPNETMLHALADRQGWTMFSVPDGVGGRFSVFSEVGLITGVCVGFDIDAFLAGAKSIDQLCHSTKVWENPALLNAVLKYIAAEKCGYDIEVFMPYADYLRSTAEWYVQLLAESLGKRCDRNGNKIYYGRTPVVAVGTTDMHAQTQQHQDGKRDKVVQFVRIAKWQEDMSIPNAFPNNPALAGMASFHLSQMLDAALTANAEALMNDSRLNATFTLPTCSAFHIGELLYLLALSIAYEGELANVNAFDQPGVEAYKRIMKQKMKSESLV